MPATESGIWVFVVIQDGKGSEIACGEMYEKATNVVSVILEMEMPFNVVQIRVPPNESGRSITESI
jgi:hypothetical protein